MNFKKTFAPVAVFTAALMLAGCGSDVKLPDNTVAAAYIDLDKAIGNAKDIAEIVIDNLPDDRRKMAEKEFEEALKTYDENFKCWDLEWAAVAACMEKGDSVGAIVVKCDYEAKGKMGASLKDMLVADAKGVGAVSGETVYSASVPELGGCFVSFVDGDYVIAAQKQPLLERFVKLYKDGDGETSDSFGDLTDIGGDTIARVQTADVGAMVDMVGVRPLIEKFGEECGDEELAEMLLDIGNVTLDINASDDILGGVLTVDAGSSDLADVLESALTIVKFGARLGSAAVAMGGDVLSGLSPAVGSGASGMDFKEFADLMREAVEIDRSGGEVSVEVEFDTDDAVESLVNAAFKKKD